MNSIYLPILNVLNCEPWTEKALCWGADPDMWFPTDRKKSRNDAMQACRSCPVIGPCAVEAHAADEAWGIRAGVFLDSMSLDERRVALADIAAKHGYEVVDKSVATFDPHSSAIGAQALKQKTHCRQNHEYTLENTGKHRRKNGMESRYCKTCDAIAAAEREARRAAEAES